jgi:F0F1-type ATP synthase membrane subunit a
MLWLAAVVATIADVAAAFTLVVVFDQKFVFVTLTITSLQMQTK